MMRNAKSQSAEMELIWNRVICDDRFNAVVDRVFGDSWTEGMRYLETFVATHNDDTVQKYVDVYNEKGKAVSSTRMLKRMVDLKGLQK